MKFNPLDGLHANSPAYRATHDQMFAVILLDCIQQTKDENHGSEFDFNVALRARLKNRTNSSGQQELPV